MQLDVQFRALCKDLPCIIPNGGIGENVGHSIPDN